MSNETAIVSLKEKIDDLNQQAWEVRVTDLPKSFELSEESVKLARSINYPKGLAEGLRSLGFSYIRFSKNEEAAPLLKESLSLFQSLNDFKGQAVIYEYLGIIERNWGNLGASLDLLLKANELILQTGPPEVEITCSYQLGVTYKHLGNHENALDYLYKTLSLAKKINLPLMEAYATNIIGSIYFDNGNYDQALDCYQQGLPIRQQSHDKWGEAGSLDNIGFTYLKLNDLDKAIDYCKQSLAICQGTGDKKGEANALLHLAEIYEQAGDVKQAASFSNESLTIRKDRGDKRGETEVLLFLADLYKNRNDVEDHQIFEWISGALKIADEIKAQDLLSKAYYNLHEYYQQKGNFKESLVQLEAHFQIEKELHKNSINQKVANLEISHKAEVVSQRNKELTELNEKIEKANEELKIERSLERVRTAAMAMKEPADMLEVCKIISDQLEILDVKKIRNVQTAIFYEEKNAYMNYEYYAKHGKLLITEVDYNNHPVAEKFANQMLKGPNQVWTHGFKGEEVKDWLKYQRSTNVFIDTYLETADSLNYYWYSLGPVALGMSTYVPLSENEIDLFKRFRNVFELAYRRYLDIEKAEAQAREAQIELALERVRARTMAMHHSGELADTASVLFQQIKELGFETWSCGFCTWTKDDLVEVWMAADSGGLLPPMMIPYKEEPTHSKIYEASLRGETAHDKVWEGKDLERHYAFLKTIPSVKEAIEILERSGLSLPSRQCYYVGFFKQGYLLLITKEPNTDLKDLSKRFAKVFEQTYTRFLDLQKAEAQAREAQIEAALERIRSASLAMHKTDDLKNVVKVLFEQLQELSVEMGFGSVSIYIFNKDTRNIEQWLALPDGVKLLHIPYFEHPILSGLFESKERGDDFFAKVFPVELKNSWTEKGFEVTDYKYLPEEFKTAILDAPGYSLSMTLAKNSGIAIPNFYGKLLSKEDNEILKRVGKVFEQSYIRFLDLKKAEAQAREAHIETALEKVRSRTMAMQKSGELAEVATVLFQQVKALGVPQWTCGFGIFEIDDKEFTWYPGSPDGDILPPVKIPLTEHPVFISFNDSRKRGDELFVYEKEGEYQAGHYKYMQSLPGVGEMLQKMLDAGLTFPTFQIDHVANFSHGSLVFITYEHFPEMHDIFKRFAKVFEQTYTRFLDLQKAETQAREAKIEAALERARTQSMIMQHSKELDDTLRVFHEQVLLLGIKSAFSFLWLPDEDKDQHIFWAAWAESVSIDPLTKKDPTVFNSKAINYPLDRNEPATAQCLVDWKGKEPVVSYHVPPAGVKSYFAAWQELIAGVEQLKPEYFSDGLYYVEAFMKYGCFGVMVETELSEDEKKILSRFAVEFERTYTRFLDLQKAEAQAREAQIEAALEKVRSRSLAMHTSEELQEVVTVVFDRLKELNIQMDAINLDIFKENIKDSYLWTSVPGQVYSKEFHIPFTDVGIFKEIYDGLIEGKDLLSKVYSREEKNAFFEYIFTHSDFREVPENRKKLILDADGCTFSVAYAKSAAIMAYRYSQTPFSDGENEILKRFAKVFEQCYTRFKDLQKAEAQAREAKIETALERVRSNTMAMHHSEELKEVISVTFEQIKSLDIIIDSCIITLFIEGSDDLNNWVASAEQKYLHNVRVPYFKHPLFDKIVLAKKKPGSYFTLKLSQKENQIFYKHIIENSDFGKIINEDRKRLVMNAESNIMSFANFQHTGLRVGNFRNHAYTEEENNIILRFANVFEQTYTRFLDLKQAEAQAREAQIELGLERVRARAMAMQNSDELNDLVAILFEELTKLDLILARCIIWIFDNDELTARLWMANSEDKKSAESYYIKRLQHSYYEAVINGWKERNPKWVYDLKGEEKKAIDKLLLNDTELSRLPDAVKNGILNSEHTIVSGSFNNFGLLEASGPVELSAEQMDIVSRFAKVFDLTYTRFNDLKQAEAQAREAKIEAALERVRAKAMAMHKSDDLTPAVATVFEELEKLNMGILRCGIAILDKEKPRGDIWVTVKSEQKSTIQLSGDEPLDYHPLLQSAYDAWLKQKDFSYILKGEELAGYYRAVTKVNFQLPISATFDADINDQKQFYYNAVFQDGSLFAFMETDAIDEAKLVMKRFANVFNLTYKRFLDLQKAEAQTHKANIETALERVRARALAMQQPEELIEVAEVLRHEMGLLGVEELETCSIYIHDETIQRTECWYALKDLRVAEKKLVSDHFPLNLNDTWVGREMAKFYKSNAKQVSIVMQGANRKEWINYCEEKSVPFRGYYGEVIPDRTYHLFKFSHGAIGAASAGDISNESWELLSRASSVFSLAYSRFKDLTQARGDLVKLKEEKKRAEDALTELQTTQKQLIQAEKMASLGELTAGIAHEIQNPLNFVNNFSDVSNELLEEMKAELEKGNAEGAKEIAIDVKENLEKILHHGKRADAIVKGMLQHSRSSGGQKELTDINVLAEEYLRLAYHGLRAKDKFFNAKFETHLDPSITKINIVPQEIGRVILNLINNSFYAVSEKKRNVSNGYEPSVTVSTKKVDDKIEIRIMDNGNGIPQKVLDKIFQPFFTTKPTGQGTGLGLSLSYDIITQGHDGEIKVETKEGEGSAFTISLPMK